MPASAEPADEPPAKRAKPSDAGDGLTKNSAFVFIKPHAVTQAVKDLVRQKLCDCQISVIQSGQIDAEKIDKDSLIDNHYGAIASRAMKQQPSDLVVQAQAQADFQKLFGIGWPDALAQGKVYNAVDGAKALGISLEELGNRFDKTVRGTSQLKFGGGFYCAKLDEIFVINGFYTKMRGKFTQPGTCIYFYEVEWESAKLAWADFRAKVIGATNPKEAAEGSLRNTVLVNWSSLALESEPNMGDNGIHASASPFEGLAEKANWLGHSLQDDLLGSALVKAGVSLDTIQEWTTDPVVSFDGKKQSLFDLLEDVDVQPCIEKAKKIAAGPN